MSIYLYLRYGKLYLKWVFVEDEQKLKLYEYNELFEYTGLFGSYRFVDGILENDDDAEKA